MNDLRVRQASTSEALAMARGKNNLGNWFVEKPRRFPLKGWNVISTHATEDAALKAMAKFCRK